MSRVWLIKSGAWEGKHGIATRKRAKKRNLLNKRVKDLAWPTPTGCLVRLAGTRALPYKFCGSAIDEEVSRFVSRLGFWFGCETDETMIDYPTDQERKTLKLRNRRKEEKGGGGGRGYSKVT